MCVHAHDAAKTSMGFPDQKAFRQQKHKTERAKKGTSTANNNKNNNISRSAPTTKTNSDKVECTVSTVCLDWQKWNEYEGRENMPIRNVWGLCVQHTSVCKNTFRWKLWLFGGGKVSGHSGILSCIHTFTEFGFVSVPTRIYIVYVYVCECFIYQPHYLITRHIH